MITGTKQQITEAESVNFLSISKHVIVWLLSLFSQCCGEVMFRQRPAAQANFHALTGIKTPFPVFMPPAFH